MHGIAGPPLVHSPVSPTGMLIGWTALAAAAAGVAALLAIRNRDPLPVAACIGALICALNEPIYDILGKLVYAQSPNVAFTAFGRHIPWTLVVGYVPWVGLMPYVLSRMMTSGISRARLHQIAAGLILSVALIEVVNAAWLKQWKYYGQTPWRGVLSGGVIQMAAMPLLCALLYCMLGGRLRGWRRALLGLILPAMTLPMVFASTTWPLYLSNYAHVSSAVAWIAAAAAIALSFGAVPVITWLAQRWRAGELALTGPRAAPATTGEQQPAAATAPPTLAAAPGR